MTSSNDPNQVARSLASLWPSLIDEPPTPQDYAVAIQRQADGMGAPAPAPDAGTLLNEPPTHLLAAQVLDADNAARRGGDAGLPSWNPADAFGASVAMAGDDGAAQDENVGRDAVPAVPAGQVGALPASAASALATARISNGTGPPATLAPPPALPSDPAGGLYRPEFSDGPDPLPPLLERSDPGHTPPGYSVDPKTGAVSRPRFVPSGDPMNPVKVELAPTTAQEMQDYFERRTGARANYQPGLMSPEERFARAFLQPTTPPARMHHDPAERLPVPDASGKAVLDILSRGEHAPSYDTVYGSGHFGRPPIPVTQMTVNQVLAYQKELAEAVKAANARPGAAHWKVASPVGKYQFISGTLKDYIKNGVISGDTVLTPEVQDRLAYRRLLDAGLDKYRRHRMSEAQFHSNLANAWRTVEAPGSTKAIGGGPAQTTWMQIMDNIGTPAPPTR